MIFKKSIKSYKLVTNLLIFLKFYALWPKNASLERAFLFIGAIFDIISLDFKKRERFYEIFR